VKPRTPRLSYRCPACDGPPAPGTIVMGLGPRVRRAYRVLNARRVRSKIVGLGVVTWKIDVERMSAEAGREEIALGAPHWGIVWDKRNRKAR